MSSPKAEPIRAQLPPYELPPYWVPQNQRKKHPDYDNNLNQFLPRTIQLCRSNASEQLGFNIRGGKEHHYGIFVSKMVPGLGIIDSCKQQKSRSQPERTLLHVL